MAQCSAPVSGCQAWQGSGDHTAISVLDFLGLGNLRGRHRIKARQNPNGKMPLVCVIQLHICMDLGGGEGGHNESHNLGHSSEYMTRSWQALDSGLVFSQKTI